LSFFLTILLNKYEVKSVKLANKHVCTPAQSRTNKPDRRRPPKVDYYSELRSWVQRAMVEAEKKEDFKKKHQFLVLLKDL
jgi:hypothetical protein